MQNYGSLSQRLRRRRYSSCLLAAAAAAAVVPSVAPAGQAQWNGTTDTNWTIGTNWQGGQPPADSLVTDIALFDSGFSNFPNAGTRSVNGIVVGSGRTASFTISSATTGTGLSIGAAGIDTSAETAASFVLTLGASTHQFTIAAPQTWTTSSTSQITVNGVVNFASQLTVDGGGTSRFANANTGAGGVVLKNGVLVINNNSGIGSGTLTINGGSLNTAGVTLTNNNPIVWNGDFTFLATGALNTGTGTVAMNGNRQVTVNGTTNALTFGGSISGSGSLTKAGTGTLALAGANTYGGGLFIKSGTVVAAVSNVGTTSGAAGPSTSTITLGDAAGASASLLSQNTVANPVKLASGAVGTLTIGNNGGGTNGTFSSGINLNGNTLTVTASGTGTTTVSGGITGSGNIITTGAGARILSTTVINNAGTITNSGTGSGTTTISARIESNVTAVIQNSATSQLTLASFNGFTNDGVTTFGLQIKSGLVEAQQASLGPTLGMGAVTLGDTTGSANATLQLQGLGASFPNPFVLGGSTGTLTISTRNSSSPVSLFGGVTGIGNLTLNNGVNNNSRALSFDAGSINNTGTLTNATGGTGTGGVAITAIIGSNVTGVTQNSSNGALTLTGNNAYTGTTSIVLGTLFANTASPNSATGTSSISVTGGTLGGGGRVSGAVTVAAGGTVSPGATATAIGTLTIGAAGTALSFADNATLTYQTGTSTADLVDLTGTNSTVSFGNTWNLNFATGSGNPVGGTFKLIDYTSTTDPVLPSMINFTGAYSGDVFIDTTNHAVMIQNVVPEPASMAALGLAAVGLLSRRRRK